MEHLHQGYESLINGTASEANMLAYEVGDLSQAEEAKVEAGSGNNAEGHGSGRFPDKVLRNMTVGGEDIVGPVL